ncbi:hypothetical protein D3C87_70580 [compost metagenome]
MLTSDADKLKRTANMLMRRAYKLKGDAYKLKRDADMLMRSAYKLKSTNISASF